MSSLAAGPALAAAGAVAGPAAALFSYNRANYMFDAGLRFERFCSARELACTQTAQYRKDLRKLTELTTCKMHCYADSAALMLALCIALYCAGRLGLHGASPPAWIINLWYTNNAAAFCWMGLTIWMGFHASFRAHVASCHLLTRKIRVPVPTLAQLDKARKLASEFEQQNWSDILRVPYLMNTGAPPEKMTNDALPKVIEQRNAQRGAPRSKSTPPTRGGGRFHKASSWVREEWDTTRAGTVMGPSAVIEDMPRDAAPEHFRLYAAVQQEWWPYDVYSRISLGIGVMCYVQGLAYYGLGHINIELRAFWIPYAVAFVLCVLHALILKFDIIDGRKKEERFACFQYFGPLAVLPATIAMSLDFRVEYNESAIVTCFILQFISYILQLLYTIRLLELVLPDEVKLKQQIGSPYWPDTWKVPSAFQHVLYLVAPPTKLAPGQHDLVRDIKQGDAGVYAKDSAPPAVSLKAQVEYLQRVFDWVFSDEVFVARLSVPSQTRCRELHANFVASRNAGSEGHLDQVVQQTITQLNQVMAKEGLPSLNGSGSQPTVEDATHDGFAVPSVLKMRQVQPWKCVAAMVSTMIGAWVFCIFGVFLEVFIGEQALVTAPHWSRPPMTRASMDPHEVGTPYGFAYAVGEMPYTPDHLVWHEEKRGIDVEHIGRASGYPDGTGARRLYGYPAISPAKSFGAAHPVARVHGDHLAVADAIRGLMHAMPDADAASQLLHRVPTHTETSSLDAARAGIVQFPSSVPEPVAWPSFFQPHLLACGPAPRGHSGQHIVAAITPNGFAAMAPVGWRSQRAEGEEVIAQSFRLTGLTDLPPLAGASWDSSSDHEGLLVMSRAGHVRSCPRPVAGERWTCLDGEDLPLGPGARLQTAALARMSGAMHAAVVDQRSPDVVSLFIQEVSQWMPLGELSTPRKADGSAASVSLSFVDDTDLLISSEDGTVLRRRISDGSLLPAKAHAGQGIWRASCGLHGAAGSTAHLYFRQAGAEPQLLIVNETNVVFGGPASTVAAQPLYQ